MKESSILEFKETTTTNTFLKTVSAFANYGDGEILFGITDDGQVCGIDAPEQACLDLENKINDSITPPPDYTLTILPNQTIRLSVAEGDLKPYLYKGKAYTRNDTATLPVDRLEFNRLILAGEHCSFEALPAKRQDLTFQILGDAFVKTMDLHAFDLDILKTLELYSDQTGYNNAAALLADNNDFPGIDIVRFGDNPDEIMERHTFSGVSLIRQLDQSLALFRQHYQYEKINGIVREVHDKIPELAFREALANALIHRTWDVPAAIRMSMYPGQIVISSPGGLPSGMASEDYLRGQLSILRNPILANVFFRLKYIEKFGTGILRINRAYADALKKPTYEITVNAITVCLPLIAGTAALSPDESLILALLDEHDALSRAELDKATGFEKAKTLRILNTLLKDDLIERQGSARASRYRRR